MRIWKAMKYVLLRYKKQATIMDKSSWDTPRKRPVSLNAWAFQSQIFTFWPPLPFSMLWPRGSVNEAYFNIEKGERGLSYRQKRCFLNLRKDADKKHLFCSNVSTLLSMIVAYSFLFFSCFFILWQHHGEKVEARDPKVVLTNMVLCDWHICEL